MRHRLPLLWLILALAAAPAQALVIRLYGEVEGASDEHGVLGFELHPGDPVRVELSCDPGLEPDAIQLDSGGEPRSAIWTHTGTLSLWLGGVRVATDESFDAQTALQAAVYGESGEQSGPFGTVKITSTLSHFPTADGLPGLWISWSREPAPVDPLLHLPSSAELAGFSWNLLSLFTSSSICLNGQCIVEYPLAVAAPLTVDVPEPAIGQFGVDVLLLLAVRRRSASGTARRS